MDRCVLEGCGGRAEPLYRLERFSVYRCASCEMMYRWPLPDEQELRDLYEDERYHASAYFSDQATSRRGPEFRIYDDAIGWLRVRGSGTPGSGGAAGRGAGDGPALLDLGCGSGAFLSLARDAGWRVEGVELSRALCERVSRSLGLDLHQGDFMDCELPPGGYEVITMWDFLEHVVDPPAVLRRARELLVPGGALIVLTIDSSSLFNSLGHLAYALTGSRLSRPLELLYDARHNYYFTTDTVERVLAGAGFRVEHRRAYRAYLGRWLSEPAPAWLRLAGGIVDLASVLARRQYRQLLYCSPA